MKYLILFIFLSFPLWAQEKVLCELKWNKSKLQMIYLVKGCEFPEDNKTDCAILKFQTEDGEIREGASPIRAVAESFCLKKTDVEIFGGSSKEDPFAYVTCDQGASKAQILLMSPDKQQKTLCAYPFSKKAQK